MSTSAGVRSRAWVVLLSGLVTVELFTVAVGVLATGMKFAVARDSFMVTNAFLGGANAVCGALIAWHRPRNKVGWLLLGAAIAQTATAAVTPWFATALVQGAPAGDLEALATVYDFAWPWAIALFLPLALWVFPDGTLVDRRWRWGVAAVTVNAVVQIVEFGADAYPLSTVQGHGRGAVPAAPSLIGMFTPVSVPLALVSDLMLAGTYLTGAAMLAVRYRRGDEQARMQLLWPLLATVLAGMVIVGTRINGRGDLNGPVLSTMLVAAVPASVAVAILRHRLLDIRLVWARTITYGVLTAAAIGIYVTIVELVSRLVGGDGRLMPSVVATVVVAAGFDPIRVRLRRTVDRLIYGERGDPVRAATTITRKLAGEVERPRDILPALCAALRLPWAAIVVAGQTVGEHGRRPDLIESVPLRHAGSILGELLVGIRDGQGALGPADRGVLELMALPIGIALRAEDLSEAMRRSRQQIVAAREEERRRIRRDLHDGLASVLTGVAFQADTVATLADREPQRVAALADEIRAGVTTAIGDVRRLINELRPAVLDDHGLVEGIRRHAARLAGPKLAISIAGDAGANLPAAVEVAAYTILIEALTNIARHSDATCAHVTLDRTSTDLRLVVEDDGPNATPWTPGIGLRSMADRAEELGGELSVTPTLQGARIAARLPLATPGGKTLTS